MPSWGLGYWDFVDGVAGFNPPRGILPLFREIVELFTAGRIRAVFATRRSLVCMPARTVVPGSS
jgi:hypothetical protein